LGKAYTYLRMFSGSLRKAFSIPPCPVRFSSVAIYQTATVDPFLNLAWEETLLMDHVNTKRSGHSLFLWQNQPCVIIGRFQNPHKECFLHKLQQDNVEVVRRKSGGGAVYQDKGNSLFSFISPYSDGDGTECKQRNNRILISALQTIGIPAEASGRNDLTTGGRKISGSAFKLERDKGGKGGILLHHGTMLLNVDFGALERYLNPNKAKLMSKGVTSVAARVVNLSSLDQTITNDRWWNALANAFQKEYGTTASVTMVDHAKLNDPRLNDIYQGLKDWDWRFGRTPAFSHHMETRFDWGIMDVNVEVANGVISECVVFSDSLYPPMVEAVQRALVGTQYDVGGVTQALARAAQGFSEPLTSHFQEFTTWFIKQL